MKTALTFLTLTLATVLTPAFAQDTIINIGHFAEWPLPAHYGQSSGAYDEALGAPTNWLSFGSSTAMFAALETGNIQIALSQGLVPFLLVTTNGHDFKIVDIAVSYPNNDNCFARPDLGLSNSTLGGTTAALPIGTTAHFNLNKTLAHYEVNPATLELLNMIPAQAASALTQGKVDIACGWGPALDKMKAFGIPLLSEAAKTDIGAKSYDAIVIRASFGADNPEVIARFLKTTADLNASFVANSDRMVPDIATEMNMTEVMVAASMQGFRFPNLSSKLGASWLGGGVQNHLNALAEFFIIQGTMDTTLEDYGKFVDVSYLKTAAELPLIDAE